MSQIHTDRIVLLKVILRCQHTILVCECLQLYEIRFELIQDLLQLTQFFPQLRSLFALESVCAPCLLQLLPFFLHSSHTHSMLSYYDVLLTFIPLRTFVLTSSVFSLRSVPLCTAMPPRKCGRAERE